MVFVGCGDTETVGGSVWVTTLRCTTWPQPERAAATHVRATRPREGTRQVSHRSRRSLQHHASAPSLPTDTFECPHHRDIGVVGVGTQLGRAGGREMFGDGDQQVAGVTMTALVGCDADEADERLLRVDRSD